MGKQQNNRKSDARPSAEIGERSGERGVRMLKFLVVVGSTREGRRGKAVAEWFLEQARHVSADDWREVDLAEMALPWFRSAASPAAGSLDPHPALAAWSRLVAESDGFVWVTAEYNHGYPAALKNAIDHLYREWVRKPVALVSYGGPAGGARAAEQLRQVAVELQMAPTRFGIHLPMVGRLMDAAGHLAAPDAVAGVAPLVEDLRWWALALKVAREADVPARS
jgi:NAD(P)H-dependent FMN reductase